MEHVVTAEEFLSSIVRQRATVVVVAEALVVDVIRGVASVLAVKYGETRVAVFSDHLTSERCWFSPLSLRRFLQQFETRRRF